MARRKYARKHARRHSRRRHHRMHGLGQMDMSSMMMPAGLGQFDYSPGMSTTTKVVLGAAVVGAAYWYFFMRSPLSKTEISLSSSALQDTVAVKNGTIVGVTPASGAPIAWEKSGDGKSVKFVRAAGDLATMTPPGVAGSTDYEIEIKPEKGDNIKAKVKVNLAGAGYFSGLGSLGRGYYSGWQGQGDPGTDFQAAGRGYNYGRYF